MELRVRMAVPADARRFSYLLLELGYEVHPDEVVRQMDQPATDVWAAENGDDVVGLLAMHTRFHFHRAALVATIDSLVVAEANRSQGVGEALMHVACRAAREAGAVLVELHSNVKRVDARRFYERLGFEVTSNYFRMPLTGTP